MAPAHPLMSRLRWVRQDGRGDPRLGAIGGSYGGGYQFLAAFTSLRASGQAGARRAGSGDHLARPQREHRARGRRTHRVGPGPVGGLAADRRAAAERLQGAGRGRRDGHLAGRVASPAPRTCRSSSAATARSSTSPQGRRLDIPVLLGQGTTDSLFHLQQGLANWRTAITRRARRRSIFVGLQRRSRAPGVLPCGISVTSDPCTERARRRRLRGAEQAVLRRAAQGASHRTGRLRPAPPRHPGLDVHHRPLGRPDRHAARRHGGHPHGRRACRWPTRSRPDRFGSPARRT